MDNKNTVLFIGRPGSGKGTQAKLLAQKMGGRLLSSGDRFKEIRDGNEPFSKRVREMYDQGILIPDWFADYLLESGLLELPSSKGIVLDGFGRTKDQAVHVLEIMEWLGRTLTVINLEVSEEVVVRRMLKRAETEDRPDSNGEDKIKARIAQFNANTAPALEYFRQKGVVVEIKGEQTPEEIEIEIATILAL